MHGESNEREEVASRARVVGCGLCGVVGCLELELGFCDPPPHRPHPHPYSSRSIPAPVSRVACRLNQYNTSTATAYTYTQTEAHNLYTTRVDVYYDGV